MLETQTYLLLADLILVLHFLVAAFIVIGLLLIIIGGFRYWHWIRNPWFRHLHLAGIGFIVSQAWLGKLCPLTTVENWLRAKADDVSYPGNFVSYWIGKILYYELPLWVFAMIYTGFFMLTLYSWCKFKPDSF